MAVHPCDGCRYWYGTYVASRCCNYMFVIGHSRPCPPGWECTEWTPKKPGVLRPENKENTKEPPKEIVSYTRNCLRCGTEFVTTREKKVYCCYHCQDRARKSRQKKRKRQAK